MSTTLDPRPAKAPESLVETPRTKAEDPGLARVAEAIRTLKAEGSEPVCAYLYDLRGLRERVAQLVQSLPRGCRLYYAMKANSEAPILRALAPIVHGFEVASLGEVGKARAVDAAIPVIFGGPGKTPGEIEGAIRQGVELIHVESITELHRVEQIASRLGLTAPILLRANVKAELPSADLHMAGGPTQFGIGDNDIPAAIRLAQRSSHVALRGFHFHSLSNNLDAERHAQLVGHFLERARAWALEFDFPLSVVNAGGGIGINYDISGPQFDWETFVSRLGQVVGEPGSDDPSIVFECGRYLTAGCGYYAVEVLDIKHNHGATFVVVRGGSHHFRFPAAWHLSHPFTVIPVDGWDEPYPRPEAIECPVTIAGQLCTPRDVLARDVVVRRLRVGDILVFSHAGAYGWTISHHDFLSHPHPVQVYLE